MREFYWLFCNHKLFTNVSNDYRLNRLALSNPFLSKLRSATRSSAPNRNSSSRTAIMLDKGPNDKIKFSWQ
jgi:hypothetical protein